MIPVVWTLNAKCQLRAAYDYIGRNSTRYAQNIVDRITRKTEPLSRLPQFGAIVPEYDDETIREVFEHPYRIIYRVAESQIEIVAVIHAARELPSTI